MEIIDCQIHVPHDVPALLPDATDDAQRRVALRITTGILDAVGVDGVILNWTPEFNELAFQTYPDRFRTLMVFEPYQGTLRESLPISFAGFPTNLILPFAETRDLAATVEGLRSRTGLVALRLEVGWQPGEGWRGLAKLFEDGLYDPIFEVARALDLPVCIWIAGALPLLERVAKRYSDVTIVIDHCALVPRFAPESDHQSEVRQLLELSRHKNIAVKFSGMIGHSAEAYPYLDIQKVARNVIDSFGQDKVMWGTDYTMHPHLTYAKALHYILDSAILSQTEQALFFGGNVRRIFKWARD